MNQREAFLQRARELSVLEFLKQLPIVNERDQKIDLRNHFFQFDIFNDWTPKQAILKGSQIGVSTVMILKTLWAAKNKDWNIIYTLPSRSDVSSFVPEKVNRIIANNAEFKSWVKDRDSVEQKEVGDNFIFYRGSWSEREALMYASDLNIHDEEDRSNIETLDQYASRLQHSDYKGTWHISNPSAPNRGVHKHWITSDQKHWFIKCKHCNKWQFLSWEDNVDREKRQYVCKKCHKVLTDENRRVGEWIPRYKDREVSGYWISQMMAPWLSADELLTLEETKDKQFFYNFVLGLPYRGSDVVVDKSIILKNIVNRESSQKDVAIGVDVGKEKHVVAGTQYGVFATFKTKDWDRVEQFFLKFENPVMVIDAMPDITKPLELVQKYKGRVFVNYYTRDKKGKEIIRFKDGDGLGVVNSDRNRIIEQIVNEMVKGNIKFHLTSSELQEYTKHWESMYRVEDEYKGTGKNKTKRLVPEVIWESSTGVDHFVHATSYMYIALSRQSKGKGGSVIAKPKRPGKQSFEVKDGKIPSINIEEIVNEKPKKDWRYVG